MQETAGQCGKAGATRNVAKAALGQLLFIFPMKNAPFENIRPTEKGRIKTLKDLFGFSYFSF